ncbi:hypothetical protein HYV57_01740 [Candidatus Peregrinibacteria bacterium]|nr:hypothetical protein [Candidatus Peregrinibacteria bacterium]
MRRSGRNIVTLIIVISIVIFGGFLLYFNSVQPGKLDIFAQCLKDKGAVFYGAFWCPHCQNQKALFGKSAKLLPYVECSTADGKFQLPACQEKKVQGYPTWEFFDGSRQSGELTLDQLSEKTTCSLPVNT